ncbi:hypothetical protein LOTGIDRAFT_157504 [Lottia gigantea]|uniref:Uncharacterized protein n=1 Tax=Lottia gigantea TaxID=225164 RepID=V4CGU2_LOTGI|nr:hypothetical protein LOTGIDRAFT_157504 [Lottia gigantea]ESP01325.1 hypothetical protein LOTGIDRAFT_157504 [Lottia gigantea]
MGGVLDKIQSEVNVLMGEKEAEEIDDYEEIKRLNSLTDDKTGNLKLEQSRWSLIKTDSTIIQQSNVPVWQKIIEQNNECVGNQFEGVSSDMQKGNSNSKKSLSSVASSGKSVTGDSGQGEEDVTNDVFSENNIYTIGDYTESGSMMGDHEDGYRDKYSWSHHANGGPPEHNPFYTSIDSMPEVKLRRKSIPLVSELCLKKRLVFLTFKPV